MHTGIWPFSVGSSDKHSFASEVACKQTLHGTLVEGWEKEEDLAPHWLSRQISANQLEAETSVNVNKHRKTWAKDNDVITNASPPICISLFRCRYSNSRDVVASYPSLSRLTARTPQKACSQATSDAEKACFQHNIELLTWNYHFANWFHENKRGFRLRSPSKKHFLAFENMWSSSPRVNMCNWEKRSSLQPS